MHTHACKIFLLCPFKIEEENCIHEAGDIVQSVRCLLPTSEELGSDPQRLRWKPGVAVHT